MCIIMNNTSSAPASKFIAEETFFKNKEDAYAYYRSASFATKTEVGGGTIMFVPYGWKVMQPPYSTEAERASALANTTPYIAMIVDWRSGAFQLPSGKGVKGETSEETASREFHEEFFMSLPADMPPDLRVNFRKDEYRGTTVLGTGRRHCLCVHHYIRVIRDPAVYSRLVNVARERCVNRIRGKVSGTWCEAQDVVSLPVLLEPSGQGWFSATFRHIKQNNRSLIIRLLSSPLHEIGGALIGSQSSRMLQKLQTMSVSFGCS